MKRHDITWFEWALMPFMVLVLPLVLVIAAIMREVHVRKAPLVYRYLVSVAPEWRTLTEIRAELTLSDHAFTTILPFLIRRGYVKLGVSCQSRITETLEDRFISFCVVREVSLYELPALDDVSIEYAWSGKSMRTKRQRKTPAQGKVTPTHTFS